MREPARNDRTRGTQPGAGHIAGESGTGKELVAQLITIGGTSAMRLRAGQLAARSPSELMEAELLATSAAVFTGAVADKKGMVQAAKRHAVSSTKWPTCRLHMQVKLLRLIQEKTCARSARRAEVAADVRICRRPTGP